MTITTHGTARHAAALIAALALLAIATPTAGSSNASPPAPRPQMHWYNWHDPSTRRLEERTAAFGSTAVIGLESMDDLAPVRAAYGFDPVLTIPALHAVEVSVGSEQLQALLAKAPTDPRIRYISPPGRGRRPMSMPNDPLLQTIDASTGHAYEWQFAATGLDRALEHSQGSPAIVVGVIDTGVSAVPDLAGKVDSRWSVGPGGTLVPDLRPEGNDDYGHGTAVASLIAANVDDGFGMAGFGGATHVIAVRADEQGYFSDTQVAIALTKLASLGARIVNMSIGGRYPSDPILVDAIHTAAAAGVLLVVSAGNEHGYVSWPAADVQPAGGVRSFGLAVGATNLDRGLADFSNSGTHLSLVAPGSYRGNCSGVLVALPPASVYDESCYRTWTGAGGARYGYLAGTSFSAPEVAGVAALVWAARPELENYEVADIIKQSARRAPGTDWTPTMGCGMLDAGAALQLATTYRRGGSTEQESPGAVCSAAGDRRPSWSTEVNQTINFPARLNMTFGDPDFRVRARASSGLPVSFNASGDCTNRGATVHLTGVGSCSITATQPGNANHNPASPVSRSFSIVDAASRGVEVTAASGAWASTVRLRFRVSGANGLFTVAADVQKNEEGVAHLSRRLVQTKPMQEFALVWHAPTKSAGVFRFCVTLVGPSSRTSPRSCGPISLR